MFNLDDVRNAMKATEVHLAASSTPRGRIRFTWLPFPNTFAVREYAPDGKLARETIGRSFDPMFAVFEDQIRIASKAPAP